MYYRIISTRLIENIDGEGLGPVVCMPGGWRTEKLTWTEKVDILSKGQ